MIYKSFKNHNKCNAMPNVENPGAIRLRSLSSIPARMLAGRHKGVARQYPRLRTLVP